MRDKNNRRGHLVTYLVVGGVITGLIFIGQAMAHPGGHGGPATVKDARAKATRGIDRLVDKLDGTDAQRAELNKVADAHVSKLVNIKNEAHALKKSFAKALMKAPKPDARELEALRVELVKLVDRGSSELLATLLDASDTLTDKQRARIRDRFSWWVED